MVEYALLSIVVVCGLAAFLLTSKIRNVDFEIVPPVDIRPRNNVGRLAEVEERIGGLADRVDLLEKQTIKHAIFFEQYTWLLERYGKPPITLPTPRPAKQLFASGPNWPLDMPGPN